MELTPQNCWHHHEAHTLAVDEAPGNSILAISECVHLHTTETIWEIYYTDFSEYTTGVQPSDWTERWDTAATWSAEVDATLIGGKYLFGDRSANGRYLLSWDDVNPQDVEILAKWKQVGAGNPTFRVVARASGGDTSEYSYHLNVDASGDDWHLCRFLNGSHTYLSSEQTHNFRTDIFHWVRFRIQGKNIYGKIWDDGSAEPAAWATSVTDPNITSGGWAGVMMNTQDIWVDLIHIAPGGLSPPSYLVVNDAYHSIVTNGDDSPLKLNLLANLDAYHDLVDDGPYFMPIDVQDCYHVTYDPGPITITEVGAIDLVMTDGGAHHDLVDDGPLPATQVYPDDTYHDLVDDGPLPATQVYPDDTYHDHAADNIYIGTVYPEDCYHLDVVTPTDLTLVQTGVITLTMTDGGAYHLHVVPELPATQVYPDDTYHLHVVPDQIWFVQDAYHDHVVTPSNLTLVEVDILAVAGTYHDLVSDNVIIDPAWAYPNDCFHLHTAPELPATQVYPDDAFHLHIPSDPLWWPDDAYHLHTAEAADVFSVGGTYHLHVVTPTDLALVQIGDVTLTMSDAGVNYHDLVDDGPLGVDEVYDLVMTAGGAYHDLIDDGPFAIYPLFVTDFGEYTTDQQPSDWTNRWHTDDVLSRVRSGGMFGGKYLQQKYDPGKGSNRYRLTWDKIPITETDGESLMLFKAIYSVWGVYQGLRITGDDTTEDNYHSEALYHSGLGTGIQIMEVNNGGLGTVVSKLSKTLLYGTYYFMRFRAQGTSLKAKIWRMDEVEPSGWDREGSDSSHSAGYVGIGFGDQDENNDELHVEWYAYLSGAGTIRVPFVAYSANHTLTDDGPINLSVPNLLVEDCDHTVIDDLTAVTQEHSLTLSDAGVNYHSHVVTPTDLALALPVNDAYHDLVDAGPLTLVTVSTLYIWNPYNHHVAGAIPLGATGDPLTLTQLHILDPENCAHDHVVPNVTLDEWELLNVEDGIHDNVPSSIDLTQWQILGLDSCYHIHAPPNVDLTQEHFLPVPDTFLLHSVPNLALTQDHTLIVQGAFNLHVVEENLSITVHLVDLDSYHISTSSTFVLFQEHDLTVVGDYLDHLADNVPMIVPITVQDNEHQVTSDLILLHQDHFLAVIGADHTHVVTDPLVLFQFHFLEVAGTGLNTDYNYFVLTSDEIDFGYLSAELRGATLTIIKWVNQ